MCGRYVLSLRPHQVRQMLANQNMPADEAPDDDDDHRIRVTYNFAPGYHGLIYRAQTNDRGGRQNQEPDAAANIEQNEDDAGDHANDADIEPSPKRAKLSHPSSTNTVDGRATKETKYKLQAAKWGLIPFWTKRPPDYSSQLRTINCRDDSLMTSGGMWNTMKQRKRCIVVAEGFYEWLKKNNGKDRLPHFVKRKDGELMCFAGLWDVVQYEGSDEKLYSYTIITTDSNKQINFLHDRMPVILEPGSDGMKKWLDPANDTWTNELQALLKPFKGELDCYPVDKAVGKVGNNSPNFVVPLDSKENKNNIANFFGTRAANAHDAMSKGEPGRKEKKVDIKEEKDMYEDDMAETRATTVKIEGTEDNAPLPKPKDEAEEDVIRDIKQEQPEIFGQRLLTDADKRGDEKIKLDPLEGKPMKPVEEAKSPVKKSSKAEKSASSKTTSLAKKGSTSPSKTRSATSNSTVAKTPTKEGNARITNFFSSK